MRIASQQHFYTEDETRKALADAVRIVDELAVPDDLRVEAFGKAFDTLTRKNVVFEQVSAAGVLLGGNGGS